MYLFTSQHGNQQWTIFMGRDKYENEDLIKYGTPQDVWLHVDNLSSAHVYIRMPEGYSIASIPTAVLSDCAQLVKANSIEGCKRSSVKVVYTLWSNLYKRGEMEVGQIGFHDTSSLHYVDNVKKNNEVVNRLNKTKNEKPITWIRDTKEEYGRRQRQKERQNKTNERTKTREDKEKAFALKEESLESLFSDVPKGLFQSNQNMDVTAEEYENDFM